MENNQKTLGQVHFRYLRGEEIEYPFVYLNEFCERETEIHYFRQDILDLLKTAYSYQEKFYTGHEPSYGYHQRQLIKVVEAMYVLHVGDMDLRPGNIRSYENRYERLSNDERNDIRIFLEDFFAARDLEEWRSLMDELLIFSYKEGGEGYFSYLDKPFEIIEYFEKLIEAVFLVYEIRRLKERYPKASDDTVAEAAGGSSRANEIDTETV